MKDLASDDHAEADNSLSGEAESSSRLASMNWKHSSRSGAGRRSCLGSTSGTWKSSETALTAFDERVWAAMVQTVTVHAGWGAGVQLQGWDREKGVEGAMQKERQYQGHPGKLASSGSISPSAPAPMCGCPPAMTHS